MYRKVLYIKIYIILSFRHLLGILEHIAKYNNEYIPLQNIEIRKANKWRHT